MLNMHTGFRQIITLKVPDLSRFFAFLCFSAISTGIAHAESGWICVADQSTGFSFAKGSSTWIQTNFRSGDKYLIVPLVSGDFGFDQSVDASVVQYGVKKFGSEGLWYWCNAGIQYDFLNCKGYGEFRVDLKRLRFLSTYTFGYVGSNSDGTEDTGDTPSIDIGTCAPF